MNQSVSSASVPKLSQRFLGWALPDDLREVILGDLEEAFYEKSSGNLENAKNWYRRQAIRTGLKFIIRTKQGVLMLIASVCLFAIISCMAMWMSGGLSQYVNLPSVLVILPLAITFTIAVTSWQNVNTALELLAKPRQNLERRAYQTSQQVFVVMGRSSMLLGFFMTLIGLVAMANKLNVENFGQVFAPSAAVCLLTLLYGLAITVVCFVAEQKIINLSIED